MINKIIEKFKIQKNNLKIEADLSKIAYFQLNNTIKKLAESEDKFAKIFYESPHAITISKISNSQIIEANKAFFDIFGYTKEEVQNNPTTKLKLWVNNKDRSNILSQIKAGKIITNQTIQFKNKSGKVIDVLFSAQTIKINDVVCILSRAIDITQQKENEKKALESELRYRRLFETAKDGVLLIDFKTGMILDVNPFLTDLLGYSKNNFLKKHLWEVGVFKDIAASKENFKILQNKRYVRFEDLPLETKSGKSIDVEFVANAYSVGDETIIQCNIRDITDRKIAEDQVINIKTRDEAILDSIGDSVFACDTEGKILLFNHMAEQMTGILAKNAIGKKYSDTIHFIKESDGEPCDDFVSKAINNGIITKMSNHTLLVTKDGQKIPVADSAAPIKNIKGEIIGCVVVFHDVSIERQIDKAKTEFVSLASHQLRTPLSTISWYSEMLLSSEIGKLSKKQKQYSQEVYHANQRMIALVNALLNVSRLELGTFVVNPKATIISKIVNNCIKDLTPLILKKNITISTNYQNKNLIILVDPNLLTIILHNLLSNSIKYSKKDGRIVLDISKNTEFVTITVTDNGIGIPKEQQKYIFKKLFRANNAKTTDPDGSGLGLYIVKEIMTAAGGKVWFTSTKENGTIFRVNIPLSGMAKKQGDKILIL